MHTQLAVLGGGPGGYAAAFIAADEGLDVTLADALLVPQMYNARRFKVPLDEYPRLVAVTDACNELPAFQDAAPESQPDCV